MHPLLFLAFIVLSTLVADYLLKLASARPRPFLGPEFLMGAAIYALSAFGWVLAMRRLTLASIGVYYSMLTLLLLAAMGVLFFGERLSAREVVGIGLACASIALMTRLH